MAERELRIRTIADVSQAKAALASLTKEQLATQSANASGDALDLRRKSELLKIQLEQAKALGKSKDEIKGMAAALKQVQAEARIVQAEAKFINREFATVRKSDSQAARAAALEEKAQARFEQSLLKKVSSRGRASDADGAKITDEQRGENKGIKLIAQRLGIPEAAVDNGKISPQVLLAGVAAAVTAAIVAGFKTVAEEQRAAQKNIAQGAIGIAGTQDAFVRKASAGGATNGQIARILGLADSTRGVASTEELVAAATQGFEDGGVGGAEAAIRKAAAGTEAITSEQQAAREVRRRKRNFEIQASLSNAGAIAAAGDEDLARLTRQDLAANGGITVLGRGLAAGASLIGLSEEAQLAAINAGNTATLVGRNGEGSRYTPIRVEVSNPGPRPLNGD
jgi:hypothetical protein